MNKYLKIALGCALLSVLAPIIGCAVEGSASTRWLGLDNSYHLLGEEVEMTFIPGAPREVDFQELGINAALGAVIDIAEAELRKEAARYSQEYAVNAFYTRSHTSADVTPPRGFTITRKVDVSVPGESAKQKAKASHIKIELVGQSDSRLYRLQTTELRVDYAKTKISEFSPKGTLDVGIAVTVEALWMDDNKQMQKQNLTIGGGASVRDVQLGKGVPEGKLPPLGYIYVPTGNDLVLRFSAVVTERDSSKISKAITSGADLLRDNRTNIINAATGAPKESDSKDTSETSGNNSAATSPSETDRPGESKELDRPEPRELTAFDAELAVPRQAGYRLGVPSRQWREAITALANGDDEFEALGVVGIVPPIESFFFQSPETICDVDERRRIKDPSKEEWNARCRLIITLNDGRQAVGSGWLLDDRLVVTAGHCVHEGAQGDYYRSVEVIPAANGLSEPFGSQISSNLRASTAWRSRGSLAGDYGAIILDEPFTDGNRSPTELKMRVATDQQLRDEIVEVAGYPADQPVATLWAASDLISTVLPGRLRYYLDTYGGQSGSAVVQNGSVVGIHNYGGCPNSSTRITREVETQINRWIAESR